MNDLLLRCCDRYRQRAISAYRLNGSEMGPSERRTRLQEALLASHLGQTCDSDSDLLATLRTLSDRLDELGQAAWQIRAFLAQFTLIASRHDSITLAA